MDKIEEKIMKYHRERKKGKIKHLPRRSRGTCREPGFC